MSVVVEKGVVLKKELLDATHLGAPQIASCPTTFLSRSRNKPRCRVQGLYAINLAMNKRKGEPK